MVLSSDDDGATWSTPERISPAATPGTSRYTNCGILALASGRLLSLHNHGIYGTPSVDSLELVISDDDGDTWGAPIAVPGLSKTYAAGSQSLFQTSTGRVILSAYGQNTGDTDPRYRTYVAISDDEGETWTGPIYIGPGNDVRGFNESSVVETPTGELLIFIRTEVTGGNIYKATSTDDGSTWSTVTPLPFAVRPGMPTACYFPGSDVLLLVYRKRDASTPLEFFVAYRWSLDDGATWSLEETLITQTSEYQGLAVIAPDRIGCLFAVDHEVGDDVTDPGQADLKYVDLYFTD